MKSNIRKLRNEKQISQTTLANVIGKTQQTVSHMERDRDRIPIESLITLADYFGVSTDYILGREEQKTEVTGQEEPMYEEDAAYPENWQSLKNDSERLGGMLKSGDSKLFYELILSLLLRSMEEKV